MRTRFVVLLVLAAILAVCLAPASADETTIFGGFGIPLITVKGTTVISSPTAIVTFSNKEGGTVNGWALGQTFTAPVSEDCSEGYPRPYKITEETCCMSVDLRVFGIEDCHLKGTRVEVEGLDGLCVSAEDNRLWVDLNRLGPGRYFLVSEVRHDQSRRDYRFFFIRHADHVMRTDQSAIAFNVQNVNADIVSFLNGQCGVQCEKDLPKALWPVYRSRVYSMFSSSIMLACKPADYQEISTATARAAQGFAPPFMPRQNGPDPAVAAAQAEAAAAKAQAQAERERAEAAEAVLRKMQEQQQASPVDPPPASVQPSTTTTPVTTSAPPVKSQAERLREAHTDSTFVVALDEQSGETSATLFLWVQQDGRWIAPNAPFTVAARDKGESWFTCEAARGYTHFALSTSPDTRTWTYPLDGKVKVLILTGGEIHEG